MVWYGSKLTHEVGEKIIYKAGGAITCGPLQVIARVTGLQTSYRVELQSFAVNSALASANQELTCGYKAAVDHALVSLLAHGMVRSSLGYVRQIPPHKCCNNK